MNGVSNDAVLRFGDAEFDCGTGRLQVGGQPVELDAQCRAVLAELLARPGEVVSKYRLLEAGWPGRTVHENSLAKAIGRLRVALGEQGHRLETVYGQGYKLGVELRPAVAALAPPPGPPVIPARRRPRWLHGLGLAAVAAVAGGAGYAWLSAPPPLEEQFRDTPPLIADAPDAIGRLLWVDDNPSNNAIEKALFEERRIAVHPALDTTDALRLLAMYDYDLVVSDMGRGEDRLAGIRLVEAMRARGDETPYVIYTLPPDSEEQRRAQREMVATAGAQGVTGSPQGIRGIVLERFGNPAPRQ